MTTGEKLKCYRALKKMTQKALGELSGIGEATIRKYELGIRNPKPAQLKKIAQALEMNENVFFDIPLSNLNVETVGDVMALFFLLEDRVGFEYGFKSDNQGSDIFLHFKNDRINKHIVEWFGEKSEAEQTKADLGSAQDQMTPEEISYQLAKDATILEITKKQYTSDDEPLPPKSQKI